jgi:hypothetical protein
LAVAEQVQVVAVGEGKLAAMIDSSKVCLFIPENLKAFKLDLFHRIGAKIQQKGGSVICGQVAALGALPSKVIPIIGCSPELKPLIDGWRRAKRSFIYWDRGYFDRVFATCLPTGDEGGYYRWHLNSFQMTAVNDVPADRWKALKSSHTVKPWSRGGRHIVIAAPTKTYCRFHKCENWIADTIDLLARHTDRQLVIRDKEQYRRRPIQTDIEGAHALVTHGSNAAVESVVLGCPVFVHHDSAAALVGKTDLTEIEKPVYPDREAWLQSLAYCQFNERELTDGTLWRLME